MTVLGVFGFGHLRSAAESNRVDVRRYVRCSIVAALTPAAVLLSAGLLLVARRLAGALIEPPSLAAAATCAVVILAAARASSLVWRLRFGNRYGVEMPLLWLWMFDLARPVCWAAALIWAIALSLPGISSASAAVLWSPVVMLPIPRIVRWVRFHLSLDRTSVAATLDTRASVESGAAPLLDQAYPGASLVSHTTRNSLPDGSEVVEGIVSVDFAAGARWGAAHLAFCPPLAGPPVVAVSADEDIELEIKVVQALSYAARFDVRLAEQAEERLSVRLRYRLFAPVDGDSSPSP